MVEIIPKPTERVIDWKKILPYFSVLILVGVIISYFILVSREKKFKSYLQNLEEEITKGKTPQRMVLEKELLDWERKINDFAPLLEKHLLNSQFFELLATSTHPKVFFSKIDLNSATAEVTLSGQADSFLVLGQQILILSKDPLFINVNLASVSISKEGKIEFSLKISLNPKVFKY